MPVKNERPLPPWAVIGSTFVNFQVVAKPGNSQRGILRRDGRGLVIGLNSPPLDGRANSELLQVLTEVLRVPRSSASIVRGHASRVKTVRIETPEPARIAAALASY